MKPVKAIAKHGIIASANCNKLIVEGITITTSHQEGGRSYRHLHVRRGGYVDFIVDDEEEEQEYELSRKKKGQQKAE